MKTKPAFYISKVVRYGTNMELRQLRERYVEHYPEEAAEHAVVDNSLLHLCCWSLNQTVAETVAAAMVEEASGADEGDVITTRMWPHDVSGWPSVHVLDAEGEMHLSPSMSGDLDRTFVADGDCNG